MMKRAFWVLCAAFTSLVLAIVFFFMALAALIVSPIASYVLWNNNRRFRRTPRGPDDGFSEAGN